MDSLTTTQHFPCVHMFSQISIHTCTRASIYYLTPRLEIVRALLRCSCWFRLPLPLAGSQPAVTLTLALQICSVQQNLPPSLPLLHTWCVLTHPYNLSFCFLICLHDMALFFSHHNAVPSCNHLHISAWIYASANVRKDPKVMHSLQLFKRYFCM